jgi:Na+-translocating ferredoxin:NAD+ oxidoreductase RnfG subunit
MCCWAGSSRALRVAAVALLLLGWSGAASSKVFLTVDEALRLVFAGSKVERRTAYLTKEQVRRAAELSGEEVAGALVTYYQGPGGFAYFDTHRVRTLPETLMVVVDPQGKVRRIEVITFREPEEYMPRGNWYGQFQGRKLDRDLAVKRGIHPVTGATLTVRATTDAVRRVLALHQVITEGSGGKNRP